MYTYSILHSKTEVHGIITAGAIDTLKVPDPSEQQQTQGTLTLPRGSIDINKGEGDNTGTTLISLLSKLSLNFHINIKVVRNSFMARANWVLINKPNLARAVDAHAQMLILSCRNFGVFITLTAHISASARWNFFIFSVITRINWLHT